MKKSILTLFILLVCAIQTATAWDYLTIYFHNGSKPTKFYLADIDSICYSKIDIDSITQSDWLVQEIWAIDSIYRYLLSDIDSISYTTVNIDDLAKDIAVVSSVVEPLYMQCDSISQLSEHISLIQNTEEVENAWIDGQALYVKVRNYEPMVFLYPPHNNSEAITDSIFSSIMSQAEARSMKVLSHDNNHQHIDVQRACIVNQPYYDEDRKIYKKVTDSLHDMFASMDKNCEIINKPTPDFFSNDIFGYDLILLITHGEYNDNKHWLLTGEELLVYDGNKELTLKDKEIEWARKLRDAISKLRNRNSLGEIRIGWVKEIRDGKQVGVIYSHISENYIKNSHYSFKKKAIIFNAACESMKGNSNLGLIFVAEKGAGYYLGYTDTNTIGYLGGCYFFKNMLNGKCTDAAFEAIPNDLKEEKFVYNGKKYHPILKEIGKNRALCISHPQTISAEYQTSGRNEVIQLKGNIKVLSSGESNVFGFQYSTNSDMSQSISITAEDKYDSSTLYMNWETTLNNSDLQPNTTYYYRAYMNDGYSNCYGEIKQFTTKSDAEAYVVFIDNTLIYYYDDKCKERNGYWPFADCLCDDYEIYVGNTGYMEDVDLDVDYSQIVVKKVIFDASFANLHLSYCRFDSKYLTSIENISYLNTDGISFSGCSSLKSLDLSNFNTASITSMWKMFYGCSSLTSLNLSNFNTANVKNMYCMFDGCKSLKNLNLSSFNTANVTDMGGMFGGCSSLTSLNLSSFNTANVTDMGGMFGYCSSLTSLNLSSFNTANVTDMAGMFYECSSLTSLNLSSFNTANVKDMEGMFWYCSSLTSLNLSNFNTANVTNMKYMFVVCSSLTSLNLSNFNTANVKNMNYMFDGCKSLKNLNLSSFNTANVTDMAGMFRGCSSLTSLNLSSFNTANVTNMRGMFGVCSSLRTIYAGNWKSKGELLFTDCNNLVGGKGTKIGSNLYGYDNGGYPLYYYCSNSDAAAHIDGGKDNPGLFTAK